jgi:hypothetical protein
LPHFLLISEKYKSDLKITNNKFQFPNKLQITNFKHELCNLELEIYLEIGTWDLELAFRNNKNIPCPH